MLEESVPLNEVILEKIRFGLSTYAPNVFPQDLDYEKYRDIRLQHTIETLSWSLLGKRIEKIKYPSTWWDAFKDRWYPKFLKKRFPINWEHFRLYNICPHINEAWVDNKSVHLNWIENEKDFAV